jgi:hypothetical protein
VEEQREQMGEGRDVEVADVVQQDLCWLGDWRGRWRVVGLGWFVGGEDLLEAWSWQRGAGVNPDDSVTRIGGMEGIDGGLDGEGSLSDARWAVDLGYGAAWEASGRRS